MLQQWVSMVSIDIILLNVKRTIKSTINVSVDERQFSQYPGNISFQ